MEYLGLGAQGVHRSFQDCSTDIPLGEREADNTWSEWVDGQNARGSTPKGSPHAILGESGVPTVCQGLCAQGFPEWFPGCSLRETRGRLGFSWMFLQGIAGVPEVFPHGSRDYCLGGSPNGSLDVD